MREINKEFKERLKDSTLNFIKEHLLSSGIKIRLSEDLFDDVTLSKTIDDLDLDSLDVTELIMFIEDRVYEEFNGETKVITHEDIDEIQSKKNPTIEEIVDQILSKM